MSELLPVEKCALTVALAQVLRGDQPMPNVATVCVLALARLDGCHDWTKNDDEALVFAMPADQGDESP